MSKQKMSSSITVSDEEVVGIGASCISMQAAATLR